MKRVTKAPERLNFSKAIENTFRVVDEIAKAHLEAIETGEEITATHPTEDGSEINEVRVHSGLINSRAELIRDMILTKGFLEQAGLSDYTERSLERLLNIYLGPLK